MKKITTLVLSAVLGLSAVSCFASETASAPAESHHTMTHSKKMHHSGKHASKPVEQKAQAAKKMTKHHPHHAAHKMHTKKAA